MCDSKPRSDECLRALEQRANGGDWRAARDLGLYRFNTLEERDKKTLGFLRQWATNDPLGLPALAEILSGSCKKADRIESIARLQAFAASKEFAVLDAVYQKSHLETLEVSKNRVDLTPENCANLS